MIATTSSEVNTKLESYHTLSAAGLTSYGYKLFLSGSGHPIIK